MKTKHDWSKAPSWAVAGWFVQKGFLCPDGVYWSKEKLPFMQQMYGYEERPEPVETCEEQEAWDQLEAARRALFERRMEEAQGKPVEQPGSALASQEGGGHYKDMAIQPVEYIHRNGLGFIEGAVIKYVSRHKAKNGAEDLRKAAHFIQILLELEYGQHR